MCNTSREKTLYKKLECIFSIGYLPVMYALRAAIDVPLPFEHATISFDKPWIYIQSFPLRRFTVI